MSYILKSPTSVSSTWPRESYPDTAGISPGIYLTLAQWRRILEEFGTHDP
jgi:hypothetical protein